MQRRGDRVSRVYYDERNDRYKLHVWRDAERLVETFRGQEEAEARRVHLEQCFAAAAQAPREVSVKDAVEDYRTHLERKGNKDRAIARTMIALRRFLEPDERPLAILTQKWGEARYEKLTGELAVDSHRNYLAEAKTFLEWCCDKKRRWLGKNPLAGVKGIGRRNPGGKGKHQPRLHEWVKWQAKAQELAAAGDAGAVAAALAAEGVDASQIVTLRVRDVDGALLWLGEEEAKNEGRRRPQPISPWLTPHLQALCQGATPMAWLFRTSKGKSGHPWRDWPREQVEKICLLAEVPRFHAHGMRGFAATLASLGGADAAMDVARRRLGHAPGSTMTTDSYAADEAVALAHAEARLRAMDGGRK